MSSFLQCGKLNNSLSSVVLKADCFGKATAEDWNKVNTEENLVILSSFGFMATMLTVEIKI
ncbi:MAG: hypothetical protein ACJBCI_04410 [Candidatus Tisiphia sp.]